MSFFSGKRNDCHPGQIRGNPLSGLCEKVCIQAKKVFDACQKQQHLQGYRLELHNFTPVNFTLPLKFVSGQTSTTKYVRLKNVEVTRFEDRPNFARITATAVIPVDVIYEDANGQSGVAEGTIRLEQDIVLYVPPPSVLPFRVVCDASVIIAEGQIENETLVFEGCVLLILKVVADTELLVPAYGYCHIPHCQNFNQDMCAGFFELPLFPR
ncbi:MAG: hypothetical protein FWE53_03670 [Firmicutes bacterium]|nr:hypothetical protein [Bacillota bacterium]